MNIAASHFRAIWRAFLLALAVLAAPALAQAEAEGPQSGTLLLLADDGEAEYAALRLGTDMDVTVSGSIARVRVTQVFRNTSEDWVEGVYLYPLPDNAAVDTLKMTVGNRVIIGRIKGREDARQIYETARAEGRRAGLVEQERPNVFTNSVANIGPGETVLVAIEYQMVIEQSGGKFSLRLPLVVGPRYVPPASLTSAAAVKDARAMTAAPVRDPRLGPINPVSIRVDLAPGFVPANIDSAYHRVAVEGAGERRVVTLAEGEVPADRDFELSWISAAATPTAALYREERGGEQFVMIAITPPFPDEDAYAPPREMVFVIDNSGSMAGTSMREAKSSLLAALASLRPGDHFNVIRFNNTLERLFDQSVPATADNLASARAFAGRLEATGGTEMLPALVAALEDRGVTDRAETVRQVIFLTDGNITNEAQMLEAIAADEANSRVFTVGIGSAPNVYLMNRMAEAGRGTATIIGNADEVAARMERLIDTLSRPAMQDLSARIEGGEYGLTPAALPDLYAGEPLIVLARGDSLAGTITLSGRFEQKPWSRTLAFADALPSPSVARLWARSRIDELETERALGRMVSNASDVAVEQLGLKFAIVTRRTSLVAVDETPARPDAVPLRREDLPINLPAGWDFDALFGGEAARAALANEAGPPGAEGAGANPATPAPEAAPEAAPAPPPPPPPPPPSPPPPPRSANFASPSPLTVVDSSTLSVTAVTVTSTRYLAQLIGGLLLVALGLLGLAILRRRKETTA